MLPEMMTKVMYLYENDMVSQKHYLSILGESVRSLPLSIFLQYSSFFVPNNDYLAFHWGQSAKFPEHGLYNFDGLCIVDNCIVVPCQLISGDVVGWVAFNPLLKVKSVEENDRSESYYLFPQKHIFDKGNYLFVLPEIYKQALYTGYIILTDGLFDCMSLTHYGLNSCSALGSIVSEKSMFLLHFIDKVYVSIDNDEAGQRFFKNVSKFIPSARYLKQSFHKDIDDLLKREDRSIFVEKIFSAISDGVDILL